ncbi:Uncharacterised protein [Mycobacteroides abscessus subsp. abscessus]|nr:Uncharacterised protein [Mycobacteroides abscessus subsp. abscessus]
MCPRRARGRRQWRPSKTNGAPSTTPTCANAPSTCTRSDSRYSASWQASPMRPSMAPASSSSTICCPHRRPSSTPRKSQASSSRAEARPVTLQSLPVRGVSPQSLRQAPTFWPSNPVSPWRSTDRPVRSSSNLIVRPSNGYAARHHVLQSAESLPARRRTSPRAPPTAREFWWQPTSVLSKTHAPPPKAARTVQD